MPLLALVALGAIASGCSSAGSTSTRIPTMQESTGSIGAQLQIGGDLTISSANYLITGPNGFMVTGPVDLSHSSELAFTVGGIPAGSGYSLILTATATDGVTTCAGSATFSVTAGGTTQVMVHLDCHQPSATGTVSVSGTTNVCPSIDSISAMPNQVTVGSSLALTGAAHDPDSGPSPLSFQWTATSGTFSDAGTASPLFTCTAVGTATLTLTVSDGDTSPGCPATQATTVTCTPADASDSGVDDDGPIEASPLPESGVCTPISDGGCLLLPPDCSASPVLSVPISGPFVFALPAVAQVGQTITLGHSTEDPAPGILPDGGATQISFGPYSWAASAGLLQQQDMSSTSLTCTDVGTVTLWLIVGESGGNGASGSLSACQVSTTVTCVADDAGSSGP
jgi:hypothetical protein